MITRWRTTPGVAPGPRPAQAIKLFAATVAFGEASLYAVLAPLLPALAGELGLSDPAAGRLAAAYPVGMVLATWPAGHAAVRRPRGTAICGMWGIALSSIGFALGSSEAVLSVARLVQGMSAAAAWAGALAWVISETAPSARGTTIATTIGAGLAGTVVAPVLAAVGNAGARREVFLALAVVLAGVAAWGGPAVRSVAPSVHRGAAPCAAWAPQPQRRPMIAALGLMLLIGAAVGTCLSLGALELAAIGVSNSALAGLFLCAYASQAVISAPLGRLCDRLGAGPPLIWCLATLSIGLLTVPLIHDPVRAAIVVGVVASLAIAGWPLVTVLVTEIGGPRDGANGMAMALVNGAWATGAALGAAGSTAVASAVGPSAWYVPLAIGCGIGAAGLLPRARWMFPAGARRGPRPCARS